MSEEPLILMGIVARRSVDESEELHVGNERLASWAEDFNGKNLSVRYWVADKPLTPEEAVEAAVMTALGYADTKHKVHYSDVTGYLWTDEKFKVGGHDMMDEIESYVGKFLILEVIVHGPGVKPPLSTAKQELVEMIRKSGAGWLI